MEKSKLKKKDYVTTVTILENISDAIFILNPEGKIEYANESSLKLLHSKSEQLIGKYFDEILVEDHSDNEVNSKTEQTSKLIEKLNQGIFENIETAFKTENGSVPIILNFSVIKNERDKLRYIIVTAKDITHWKNLEKELKQQQAISISRERLRLLGELSVGLIHKVTQPLLSLKMTLELLENKIDENGIDEKEIRKSIQEMDNLVSNMEDSIQNIRNYAQQTDDNTRSLVNINSVINQAKKLLVYELNERNLKYEMDTKENIPYFSANRLLIEQTIIAFIKNSIDAFKLNDNHEESKNRIIIRTEVSENKWIKISIKDNAGGIPDKIKKKVFEPFFTTKQVDNHSGVGLSIAKSVISSLGGDITLKSDNNWTNFVIRIPVEKENEKAQLFNLIEMLKDK